MVLSKTEKLLFILLLVFSLSSFAYADLADIIVDHSSANVSDPQVAADGNGHVYVVWEDIRNGRSDIYFNYSADYGFTYQDIDIRIDTDVPSASHSRRPQIACDNTGHVYVVWEDERNGGTDIYFNYSSNYGVTWQTSDEKLNSVLYALIPQYPKITCDNSGHVYVAWDDNYFNTCTIDINGVANCLPRAIRISTTGGVETKLTCDQNGHVYVAWRTSDILFNYSSDCGNTWQSDITISDADPIHAIPYGLSLNSDESGNVYFAWDDGRNSTDFPDVYFNSCSDYGNICRASSDIRLNTGTPGSIYSIWPKVACDDTGHVYVTWYDRRNGQGDIYMNFYNLTNWQGPDIRLDTDSPGAADSGYPVIASDNNARICVIWTDDQAGVAGLYTNYSTDAGVNWLSANRKIGSGGVHPQMVTDGSRFYMIWDNNAIVFNEVALTEVPPFPPADPSPEDGATQVSLTPTLSWRGGDANLDDALTYDVLFGTTSPPPLVSSNQGGTTYTPLGNLSNLTIYYWQVVARDSSQVETPGTIWSFTTISGPPEFVSFSPIDGATGVQLMPDLSWTATDPDPGDTLLYDVYFGQTNPPARQVTNYASNTYHPGLLKHNTVYYWKVVARDNHGTQTVGPVLSFTTINNPPQFYSNWPSDGATGVDLKPTLRWTASDPDGDDTVRYDVYFGTSSPPPMVSANQTVMNYYTSDLTHMTTYYWKVVARDNHGAETSLPVLSFTTLNHAPQFLNYWPSYQATKVSLIPNFALTWSTNDLDPDDTMTYDVYFGTASTPPLVSSNQTAASYQPPQISPFTRYYWKVVARDHHGAETVLPSGTTITVLYFNTSSAPPQFSIFSPGDGTSGVDPTTALTWSASDPDPDDTLKYDVYFGTSSSPPKVVSNQTTTTYQSVGPLPVLTVFYWQIVARDNHGDETAGPILSFTTGNRAPQFQSFAPPNLTTGISLTRKLTWSASDLDPRDTLKYDVYFGTTLPPPLVATNKTATYYQLTDLLPLTTYYWKVVVRDNHGAETIGPDLMFTTGPSPPSIESVSPNPCQTLQIITILGQRFGNTKGDVHIGPNKYGPTSKWIKMWSDTRIDFKIPAYGGWPSGTTVTRKLWIKNAENGMISKSVTLTINKP